MPRARLVHPTQFVTPKRLDYVVKYKFFQSILRGKDLERCERFYRWHIYQRTGGKEPRSYKSTLDDHVWAAYDLLFSIQVDGFQADKAVKIGSNHLPIGTGAHRVAACLALDVPIMARFYKGKEGKRSWGFEWFIAKGISDNDLKFLVDGWIEVSHLHG